MVRLVGPLRAETIPLGRLRSAHTYSFQLSLTAPGSLTPGSRVRVAVRQGAKVLVAKTLHWGDLDLSASFAGDGEAAVEIAPENAQGQIELRVMRWPAAAPLEREPNDTPAEAQTIRLGTLLYASADDNPYLPLAAGRPKEPLGSADWYRFRFDGAAPQLLFLQIELTDRDHLPVDISLHRERQGKMEPYFEGEDPVAIPHEVQALPGNKFTTRVLREPGDYYICVRANHPEYRLRTRVYDPPPYAQPRQAVQTAIDYLIGAGDSWHANTPRRGGLLDRVSNLHQETTLCVACHPTHFSQRAQLYAKAQGYAVNQRPQLQFLAERFYNNPRPLYGFEKEGAVWSRMISAPANVLGRMSTLLDLFEQNVSGERRDHFHQGVAEYLKLYYADRTKLPPDETNGNTPLVSAHEVAWYAWRVTRDARLPGLVAQGEVKNTIDLAYQTLALADMDRAKFAEKIRSNAERLLSLQRPSGHWAAKFGVKEPEAEFQTGHALWALRAAGIPASHPQVARALKLLLARQQPFGAWMDPLQPYENFRTPFRESQMAVLALSAYYPAGPAKRGWDAPPPPPWPAAATDQLPLLDELWNTPSAPLLRQVRALARAEDVFLRQAAIETLGRWALAETAPDLAERLGDPSKLVQRTAAWALRQVYSRHPEANPQPLTQALTAANVRTRWGATRVFAHHFAALAPRPEFAAALDQAGHDAFLPVRIQALKGLWQAWFWNARDAARDRIENTFLAQLDGDRHPWLARNIDEGLYNLADENIRYYYNNWVPLLGRDSDRLRAIQGRLRVESRLADKFARTLEQGSPRVQRNLLAALSDFHLRHSDVYEPLNQPAPGFPPFYNRIGNDVEQIAFFGSSADRFSRALLPLFQSPDAALRKLAAESGLLVREVRFPGVNDVAGTTGEPTRAVAAQLPKEPEKPREVSAVKRATRKLDEQYFRGYIQPILEKRGQDGYACVHCHASHAIFDGSWSTVMRVVDTAQPENSLILRKPTSNAEQEGVVDAKQLSHGGGIRWPKNSTEYLTILEWIKGAVE